MCEYTGDVKDPQRHCDIQLSDAEITEATKKLQNADSPFWKKKPQDKPAKPARTKTTRRPAKKKTTESAELNIDDDDNDNESEGISHSCSGESTGTHIPTFKTVPGGQDKPSKKAKLNKPVDKSNPSEPEKQQPKPSNPTAEAILDDPPPQDHEVSIDHMDIEPAISKPPSPIKSAEEKTDDVVVTRFGFTAPGQPTILSKHSAKEEISAEDKEAELAEKDSRLNDLKANIKTQQSETSKAKSELKSSLETIEQQNKISMRKKMAGKLRRRLY
nr:nucleolar and coiled-body phosphoprotein 1-like [Aegilops tauschii subsp. strangulata]